MFIVLFIIALIFFLNIKTMDFGILGKIHYIQMVGMSEPLKIEDGLYIFVVVMLVIFGFLAFAEIIKFVNNKKE